MPGITAAFLVKLLSTIWRTSLHHQSLHSGGREWRNSRMNRRPANGIQLEEEIVGVAPAFQSVMNQVGIIAKSDSTTLIQGETGTGKEVITRAIHNQSSRNQAPFVKLNCAAIPATLLES